MTATPGHPAADCRTGHTKAQKRVANFPVPCFVLSLGKVPPGLANSARFTAATRWSCLQSSVRTTPKLQPLVYNILPLPTEFSRDNAQTPTVGLQHPSSAYRV